MRKRVIVLAHEATNSGAPLVLLDLLCWITSRYADRFEFRLIFQRGGELLEKFRRIAPVRVLHRLDPRSGRLAAFLSRRLVDRRMVARMRLRRAAAASSVTEKDLIYANTASVGWMLSEVVRPKSKVLVHVHERAASFRRFATPADLEKLVAAATRYVCVSESVRSDLATVAGFDLNRATVVRNWVLRRTEPACSRAAARHELTAQLGVPPDTWIVGGVGHLDPIKGPDRFIEMAAQLVARTAKEAVAFAWIGDRGEKWYEAALRCHVFRLGLAGRVHFLGGRSDPRPFLCACDAIAICSRKEGASLVLLEAAQADVPAVVFAGSGGPEEFASGGGAGIVEDNDVIAMASLLARWRQSPEAARRVARLAAEKLGKDHDREQQCARLVDELLRLERS